MGSVRSLFVVNIKKIKDDYNRLCTSPFKEGLIFVVSLLCAQRKLAPLSVFHTYTVNSTQKYLLLKHRLRVGLYPSGGVFSLGENIKDLD